MVEVFKTNVFHADQAKGLIEEIHIMSTAYKANFDLHDCDKILRIQSESEINNQQLIELLQSFGFQAEVLPDEILAHHQF